MRRSTAECGNHRFRRRRLRIYRDAFRNHNPALLVSDENVQHAIQFFGTVECACAQHRDPRTPRIGIEDARMADRAETLAARTVGGREFVNHCWSGVNQCFFRHHHLLAERTAAPALTLVTVAGVAPGQTVNRETVANGATPTTAFQRFNRAGSLVFHVSLFVEEARAALLWACSWAQIKPRYEAGWPIGAMSLCAGDTGIRRRYRANYAQL